MRSVKNREEQWRRITDPPGYEDLYEVSNTGHVRKRDTQTEVRSYRPVRGRKILAVVLYNKNNNKKTTTLSLAALVARHFLPPGKGRVRYKDGNVENCAADNLVYTSQIKQTPAVVKRPSQPRSVWQIICPEIERLLAEKQKETHNTHNTGGAYGRT
jgi:hypothetical protein